jgi:hypothetical protein
MLAHVICEGSTNTNAREPNVQKAIASLFIFIDFFSTPLDDGLDNQWEDSGWWAVGAVKHLPIQVGYWTSPISSWTLSIRIVNDINLLLHKWKNVMSSDNLVALEWAVSYDKYRPCTHCSFKFRPSSMCSILFCPRWLTQQYSTNPTHVVDPSYESKKLVQGLEFAWFNLNLRLSFARRRLMIYLFI